MIEILSNRLRDNLGSYYPDLDRNEVKIDGTSIGGQFAKTFRFRIASTKKAYTVYVKVCPLFENLNPARLEYETLTLLYKKMPEINKCCSVARPLDYFPDLNAYAMETVTGNNLKTSLLQNNSIFQRGEGLVELRSSISMSAYWLKTFHQITQSGKEEIFNSGRFLGSILKEFDCQLLRKFRFNRKTLDMLEELFDKLPLLNGAYTLPCAKCHWDYTPGHIYLDHDKISVIDILGLDYCPIYEDIGHFLVAVAIVNNMPLYPFFARQRAREELCSHFLHEYWVGSDLDRNEFYMFSSIYMLKYLILYFGGQYTRVSERIHPIAGKLFANIRSVQLIEEPMVRAINDVGKMMNKVTSAY